MIRRNFDSGLTIDTKQVVETINDKDVAIVYYKEEDLKNFKDKSGELAKNNEYQCHYDSLMLTLVFKDNSRVFHIFPLVYYNYPQEVSSASIDFNMKNVCKTSELVNPLTIKLYKDLRQQIVDNYKFDGEMKFTLTRFNNIHKHP